MCQGLNDMIMMSFPGSTIATCGKCGRSRLKCSIVGYVQPLVGAQSWNLAVFYIPIRHRKEVGYLLRACHVLDEPSIIEGSVSIVL